MGGQDVGFARRTASTLLRPDSDDASSDEPESFQPPSSAGRYRLGALIGRGSMGAVYRGHDPELSRDVAVKILLHATNANRSRELHREAQALARIEHPNVLPCYDVGTVRVGGRFVPYVVTELVDGSTLAEWIAEQRRTAMEIVDVFAAAARGLAAVHAAGFVHRDFKPSNVLIGRDGRVLVSDFGLAQPAATPKSDEEHTQRSDVERTASTTTIAGTLAYMAPEQQRGQRCEPAADQFAFCAALHEALVGERAFTKGTWQEIWLAKVHGPPPIRGVPRWLATLVRRGLDPDPARRHPSMTAIGDALEARPRPRPRTRRAVVLSAALAATAIFAVPSAAGTNASSHASIAAATTRGRETIQREALDRIKATQRAGRLDEAQMQAAVLADEIDSPELQASLLHRRGNIALSLGRTEEAEALLARAVEVGTTAGNDFAAAAAANLLVYFTGVQQHRLDAALEWARHAEAALERIGGDDRERAVLLYALGTAHGTAGQHAEAIEHHEAALAIRTKIFGPRSPECAESHHGLGTALARYGRHDAALEHFRRALAIKEHLHGPESPMLAQTLDNVASQTFLLGDVEAALADNERARKLLARELPPGAEELLANRDNRAVMLESAGRFEEAERELQAVAQERIAQLGPSHPDVAHSLGNLGRLALQLERWNEAEDRFIGAIAILEAFDPRHSDTARLLTGIGAARVGRGEHGSAIEPLERALTLLGDAGDPRDRADAIGLLQRARQAQSSGTSSTSAVNTLPAG